MTSKITYTQEQLELELLKHKNSTFEKILDRLEERIEKLDSKIDSHFHWMVGLMFGIYAMGITGLFGALGKAYNWF